MRPADLSHASIWRHESVLDAVRDVACDVACDVDRSDRFPNHGYKGHIPTYEVRRTGLSYSSWRVKLAIRVTERCSCA